MQQTQSANDIEKKSEQTAGEHLEFAIREGVLSWGANSTLGVLTAMAAYNYEDNVIYNTRKFVVEQAAKGVEYVFQNADKLLKNGDIEKNITAISKRMNEIGLDNKLQDAFKILQNNPELEAELQGKYKQAFFEMHEKMGGYEGIAKQLGENFDKDKIKEAADFMIKKQTSSEFFEKLAVLATLCVGGYLVTIPIHAMETHKRQISEFFDNNIIDPLNALIGNAPKSEADKEQIKEKRQERYAEIDKESHRTLIDIMGGRTLALIPLYAFHLALSNENNIIKLADRLLQNKDINNPDPNVGFGGIGHYIKKAGDFVGNNIYEKFPSSTENIVNKISPDNIKGVANKDWFNEKIEWAITDVTYSLVAAIGTYGLSHLIKAKDEDKEHEPAIKANNIVPISPEKKINKKQHDGLIANNIVNEHAIV
jgi:hypothetical protein